MTARDFIVDHPYGATYEPWSPTRPHRGNDRPTPMGTPIQIGGKTIGLTGDTGLATGPHLHTQAGRDAYAQQTVDPTPFEFQPGIVTAAGWASEWGNYIIIKTQDNVHVVYAHLSRIDVYVGEVLTEGMTPEQQQKYNFAYENMSHAEKVSLFKDYGVKDPENHPKFNAKPDGSGCPNERFPAHLFMERNFLKTLVEGTGDAKPLAPGKYVVS